MILHQVLTVKYVLKVIVVKQAYVHTLLKCIFDYPFRNENKTFVLQSAEWLIIGRRRLLGRGGDLL